MNRSNKKSPRYALSAHDDQIRGLVGKMGEGGKNEKVMVSENSEQKKEESPLLKGGNGVLQSFQSDAQTTEVKTGE